MVCLVDSAILPTFNFMHNSGSINIFKAVVMAKILLIHVIKKYNATIEFYWSPLLVESNLDNLVNHRAIEKHARHWIDADVLIFNTYLWGSRRQIRVLWGFFTHEDGIYKAVMLPRVYEMALNTWTQWLDVHVNSNTS
ncbi:PC-Esterase - like 5 [Theobroma cacao]|nr:PC-Esterase - like 5 [Theobroma cacao]